MLTSSYSFTKHKAVSQTSVDRRNLGPANLVHTMRLIWLERQPTLA
jgi:hypothetical protein